MVFLEVISAGHATWLLGSLWNYVFQAAALLLLYVTLAAAAGRSIAFLATLSGVPFFLALDKSVLYDSLSQCLVAAVMAAAVYALGLCSDADERPRTWRRYKILQLITNTAQLINSHKDRQQPPQFVDLTIPKNGFEYMLNLGKSYYPEDVNDCRNSIHFFQTFYQCVSFFGTKIR